MASVFIDDRFEQVIDKRTHVAVPHARYQELLAAEKVARRVPAPAPVTVHPTPTPTPDHNNDW
jgi:hypothetical protein